MKATELRLGNLVYFTNGNVAFKITEIDNIGFGIENDFETTWVEHEEIEPIPLTEEWLLEFGANKYEFDHKANQYRIENMLFVIRENTFFDYGTGVKLQFVHQLQNLYFALNGEELTI